MFFWVASSLSSKNSKGMFGWMESRLNMLAPEPKRVRIFGPNRREFVSHYDPMKARARLPQSQDIPIEMKGAVLEAAAAVVSLVSRVGRWKMVRAGSGTIIGCEDVNGTYTSTILTSTTLLRSSTEPNALEDGLEVFVYLRGGKRFLGHVSAYDFHFNIATVDITSDVALPIACLRSLDDSISINPSEILCPRDNEVASKSFQLHRYSDSFKICPGDMVVALARSFGGTHVLTAALGKFRGRGGVEKNLPHSFLPLLEWSWQSHRPWLGMELANLYTARLGKLEKVISKFNISKGVLVEEVCSLVHPVSE
ncbi:hypothetical protein RHMOL_Rhmol10G0227400 [Rhododendron molle]|uniref:Uncharacterized protein n=1 Tax=Rhododendron molle TaxID=49168 RepID=A0ACC0M5N0_RHOML|nr:hypothetical protein RHMOL_Rhmol10G0227400 [Rhododendron molle]